MPFVRKSKYHQKKQTLNQSKTENQELIREVGSLNKKLLDSQRQNRDLQSQLSKLLQENNRLKNANIEREREQKWVQQREQLR